MKKTEDNLSDWVQWGMTWVIVVLMLPIIGIIVLLVWVGSGRPIFFVQKRTGQMGKAFWIYKFRTMVVGAEELKNKYMSLNEADSPVFKIKNDPRFTKIGKFLCHSGLDELPQLFNVLKGEMNLIGPRPLPVEEEKKIPEKYRIIRQSVKPGIVSTWVLNGHHKLNFEAWMKEDIKYIQNRSLTNDVMIFGRSMGFFVTIILKSIVAK